LAARKYARVIQKLGFPAKFKDFKIQNMVGSVDVKFPIRLEKLVLSHSQFSSYEPELFPGLIYRMVKPRIVLLIFVSGKVVLTGAKQRKGKRFFILFLEIFFRKFFRKINWTPFLEGASNGVFAQIFVKNPFFCLSKIH